MALAVDHLGKIYKTKKEMCEHYGIELNVFRQRQKQGWDLRRSLTIGVKDRVCKDHLGNKFDSFSAMARYYSVTPSVLYNRIRRGMPLEVAVTLKVDSKANKVYKDYKGVEYKSLKLLCAAYGITVTTYESRFYRGWGLKEILTTPIHYKPCKDHLGQVFDNKKQMLKHWGIDYNTYYRKHKLMGWSLEDTLTSGRENRTWVDHLGKKYRTQAIMCEHYGILVSTFNSRKAQGLSLEECLTKEVKRRK